MLLVRAPRFVHFQLKILLEKVYEDSLSSQTFLLNFHCNLLLKRLSNSLLKYLLKILALFELLVPVIKNPELRINPKIYIFSKIRDFYIRFLIPLSNSVKRFYLKPFKLFSILKTFLKLGLWITFCSYFFVQKFVEILCKNKFVKEQHVSNLIFEVYMLQSNRALSPTRWCYQSYV